MAHYAFLNQDNIVVEVIVGVDETELIEGLNPEIWYANFKGLKCKRTSYNGKIRKHYAGIGYLYSEDLDAFIPPKPFDSWILDSDTCLWNAPVDYPQDGKSYDWNEENQNWDEVESYI